MEYRGIPQKVPYAVLDRVQISSQFGLKGRQGRFAYTAGLNDIMKSARVAGLK
jgi:hypothetical protein